jgi:methanogenic corrinoid protein MtbC1
MPSTQFGEIYSQEPRYNTKAVVRETGVPADTFRAWERRYHVPLPYRTATGQRLYSERDIAVIRWLRDRTIEGLTVSQAVRLLEQHGEAEETNEKPITWELLKQQLVAALLRLDAQAAEAVLGQAFALYSLEDVCLKLITPVLIMIGQGWHDGTVSVGQEHFATQFLRRKLQGLLSIYDVVAGQATIVAACAPGEQHDVGLLILTLLLVRRGYRVVYLGADVPLAGLVPVVDQVRADLVCLSTVTAATAPAAQQVAKAVHGMAQPPLVVVGGDGASAIDGEEAPYVRIEGDARAAVDQITALIAAHRSATRKD